LPCDGTSLDVRQLQKSTVYGRDHLKAVPGVKSAIYDFLVLVSIIPVKITIRFLVKDAKKQHDSGVGL